MIRKSFNIIPFLAFLSFLFILISGNYFFSRFAKDKQPTEITPTPKQLGPDHPCKDQIKKWQTFLPNQLVYAHSGEGYDRWGIKIDVANATPCKYIIEFNVEEPYEDWSNTLEIQAYAFPDNIIRFQPPAEVANAQISIYAITPQGNTNKVILDSLEFWEGVHQFPVDPKLGEATVGVGYSDISLRINQETKLFQLEN